MSLRAANSLSCGHHFNSIRAMLGCGTSGSRSCLCSCHPGTRFACRSATRYGAELAAQGAGIDRRRKGRAAMGWAGVGVHRPCTQTNRLHPDMDNLRHVVVLGYLREHEQKVHKRHLDQRPVECRRWRCRHCVCELLRCAPAVQRHGTVAGSLLRSPPREVGA